MKSEIKKAVTVLENKGILLYPTDTVWGIGCDATDEKAVQKIYALKQRQESKSMICLVSDYEMLKSYVPLLPLNLKSILEQQEKPTTVIYNNPTGLARNLIGSDQTIAIRICEEEFCRQLIRKFNKPLVSTSANTSGQPTPQSFKEIVDEIKNGVDYIVNLHWNKKSTEPSKIIKINEEGQVIIIRE